MQKILSIIIIVIVLGGVLWYFGGQTKESDVVAPLSDSETAMEESDEPFMDGTEVMVKDDERESATQSFEVHGSPFKFSINEMRVKKGDTVRITFINDEGTHDWVVDEFDARTNHINTGEQETIEFVADTAGTFEYYCSVGSHRAFGMVGNLIVE